MSYWLIVILFSAIFLQRFALPGSKNGLPVNFFISLGALGILVLWRQMDVDPFRAALVLLFASYVLICVMFGGNNSFWTSAVFAIFMYLPFALTLRVGDASFVDCVRAYRFMMLICAVLGIAQFLLQFVISSKLLFTFEGYLPSGMLLQDLGTFQPIAYGASLNRSNGFFMVEPSVFSQYVAIAVIIEMLFFRVKWCVVVYGVALLLSYSGTGLVVLVLIPGIMVNRRSYGMALTLGLFALLALATSSLWHMNVLENRATEFESEDTSAHARFLAPADLIARYLISSPHDFLFGAGPGSIRYYQGLMPFDTHDPAWVKVLFEYGLLGSVLFWAMFVLAVLRHSPSVWLSIALTIGYLSFGGEFLDARLQALLLVFCVLPKRPIFASSMSPQPTLMAAKVAQRSSS